MSSPETLNPLYKNLINKKIAKLPSVANIYGCQTELVLVKHLRLNNIQQQTF
jgi:hypothetical protein